MKPCLTFTSLCGCWQQKPPAWASLAAQGLKPFPVCRLSMSGKWISCSSISGSSSRSPLSSSWSCKLLTRSALLVMKANNNLWRIMVCSYIPSASDTAYLSCLLPECTQSSERVTMHILTSAAAFSRASNRAGSCRHSPNLVPG